MSIFQVKLGMVAAKMNRAANAFFSTVFDVLISFRRVSLNLGRYLFPFHGMRLVFAMSLVYYSQVFLY